ncbi:MAG: NADH-quinone oxidoreductase subunit N [Euryarchaeota archaeon]|nr:NADH-quinone oxidoreductase subunit N [Euryarchaeota archaeon]
MAAGFGELLQLLADNRHLAPELILAVFALLILGLSLLVRDRRVLGWFAVLPLLLSLFLVAGMMGLLDMRLVGFSAFAGPVNSALAGGALAVDSFSLIFKFVFLSVALLVVGTSISFLSQKDRHVGEYYALILLATMGMMVVASSQNLVPLFVGIEIASLSTYALAAFRKRDILSAEAGMKYFIIGATSSAVLLYGMSILYGISGTLDIGLLSRRVGEAAWEPATIVGLSMLIGGLGFKMAAVPFHMWAPDVYEGSPTPVTVLLAAGSKKMAFAAAFKLFLVGLVAARADLSFALGIVAVLTMTVGNIVAISQTSVKRMLAYSSIAQSGYILIALAVATKTAVAGGLLHVVMHAFMKGGAFIAVAAVAWLVSSERLSGYKGLSRRSPFLAFCMAVFLLALAGIPPLSGFWSKFVLFSGAVGAGDWFVWLALAGVLNSALSLYYYARVIKYMYVDDPPADAPPVRPGPSPYTAVLVIALAATILIGLYPQPFIDVAMTAAGSLVP